MPCSADTGACCTARAELPEEVLHTLVREIGKEIEDQSPETWRWHGRNVRVVDGSTMLHFVVEQWVTGRDHELPTSPHVPSHGPAD
jgi:hypothetical protein